MTTNPVDIEVEGTKELLRQFGRLKDVAKPGVIRAALRGATRPVIKDARARVPVETGKLRRSIKATVDRTRDRTGFVASIGFASAVWYGIFVELGTAHMPARPFLRPALQATRPQIIGAFFEALDKRIKKVIAKARQ